MCKNNDKYCLLQPDPKSLLLYFHVLQLPSFCSLIFIVGRNDSGHKQEAGEADSSKFDFYLGQQRELCHVGVKCKRVHLSSGLIYLWKIVMQ